MVGERVRPMSTKSLSGDAEVFYDRTRQAVGQRLGRGFGGYGGQVDLVVGVFTVLRSVVTAFLSLPGGLRGVPLGRVLRALIRLGLQGCPGRAVVFGFGEGFDAHVLEHAAHDAARTHRVFDQQDFHWGILTGCVG